MRNVFIAVISVLLVAILLQAQSPIDQMTHDRTAEADTLEDLGVRRYGLGEYEEAIGYLEQALSVRREQKDRGGEGFTLHNLGVAYGRLRQYEKSIGYLEQALAIRREVKDRARELVTLVELGNAYGRLNQYERAVAYRQRALAIQQELGNRAGEATALNDLGLAYDELSKYEKAIEYYEQALPIRREVKDRKGEGITLNNLGLVYYHFGQYEKAIEYYEQALPIRREVGDRGGEAGTLNNLGLACSDMSQYERAAEYYEQALSIEREVKDRVREAITLHNLGLVYTETSQYESAIRYQEKALDIAREVKARKEEASILSGLGGVYRSLRQNQNAIGFYERALSIQRETKNRATEAITLNNIGQAYDDLSQYDKAAGYYEQALSIHREVKDRAEEAATLNNLGVTFDHRGQYGTAIEYYERAQAITHELKNRAGEASTLSNMGVALAGMGQDEKAIGYYQQALSMEREIKYREGEAVALRGLMVSESKVGQARLAIFYGKQAVNVYQSIRGDIRGLSKELRKSYLTSNAFTYRNLATLLAQQGRIWEAEQVLLLLKDEEAIEFIGEASKARASGKIALSPQEEAAAKQDRALIEKLSQLSERTDALKSKKTHTADEQKQLAQVRQQLETETSVYKVFLKSLESEFEKPATEADVAVIDRGQSIASHLEPGTVAVYTIASDNSYISLFFTANSAVVREVPSTYGQLNVKVKALRQALMNGSSDPRPDAQELYSIIVGSIAADLDSAHANTILWSLDGPVRHVPVAALYDGKQYLIEKYNMAMFSSVRTAGTRSANWDALALGVSREHKVNGSTFPQLSGVPNELRAIVRGKDSPRGVLPGVIKLDDQFTWGAAKGELQKQSYTVVHIASHFEFNKEKLTSSFLLLGDGSALPLNELRNEGGLFRNVDLLALSACNTAAEGDGREVDSFAKIVQDQGAASVLATLWPVYDPSTSRLMSRFYALHESSPTMTKAEALREAQLALLHGSNAAAPSSDKPVKRSGNRAESPEGDNRSARLTGAPTETRGSGKPNDYSHPYYWAPFILMGSWK